MIIMNFIKHLDIYNKKNMIAKYTEQEYQQAKSVDKLNCECESCHQIFQVSKREITRVLNNDNYPNYARYCSKKCAGAIRSRIVEYKCEYCGKSYNQQLSAYKRHKHHYCSQECKHRAMVNVIKCHQCGKEIELINSKIKLSGKHFCSNTCTGKYNAAHRTWGNSRSKLEQWLEPELKSLYPKLEIHFNRTDTIKAELDIYIPSLKLAFELNGVFHYEPIYGVEKLQYIQNNDKRKFQACLERGIELCIIDNTSVKHFTPQQGYRFLDIISGIIKEKTTAVSTSSQ